MMYRLAIDGACSGNPGPGGWAALLVDETDEQILCDVAESVPYTTSNAMEIEALVNGLAKVPAGGEVEILTDSALVIGWMTQGWKRRDPDLRKSLDIADQLLAGLKARFTKVSAHTGHSLNEWVNERAQAAALAAKHEAAKAPVQTRPTRPRMALVLFSPEELIVMRRLVHTTIGSLEEPDKATAACALEKLEVATPR